MRAVAALLSLAFCSSALLAAEPVPRPGGPGRLLMTYEVEVLTVKPDDTAAVTAWTELAAIGYHVVATAPKPDGSSVIYLERMGTPGNLQVPAILNKDPAAVEALRTRVQERRQAMMPSGQVSGPAPAPTPAVPPATK